MKTVKQLALNVSLRDGMAFDNYYVGDNVKLIPLLQELLQNAKGHFAFIWGGVGVGKTHLLVACCNYLEQQRSSTLYVSLKDHHMLQPEVFDDVDHLALVAIDDVDAIIGNRDWEETIFHVFNKIHDAGKLLLVSASASPQALPFLLPDLQSRMGSNIIWQIHALSDEDKIKALIQRAHRRGLELPHAVANYLLNHYARDTHNLFASLDVLDKASLEEQRKLTVPFVKEIL